MTSPLPPRSAARLTAINAELDTFRTRRDAAQATLRQVIEALEVRVPASVALIEHMTGQGPTADFRQLDAARAAFARHHQVISDPDRTEESAPLVDAARRSAQVLADMKDFAEVMSIAKAFGEAMILMELQDLSAPTEVRQAVAKQALAEIDPLLERMADLRERRNHRPFSGSSSFGFGEIDTLQNFVDVVDEQLRIGPNAARMYALAGRNALGVIAIRAEDAQTLGSGLCDRIRKEVVDSLTGWGAQQATLDAFFNVEIELLRVLTPSGWVRDAAGNVYDVRMEIDVNEPGHGAAVVRDMVKTLHWVAAGKELEAAEKRLASEIATLPAADGPTLPVITQGLGL